MPRPRSSLVLLASCALTGCPSPPKADTTAAPSATHQGLIAPAPSAVTTAAAPASAAAALASAAASSEAPPPPPVCKVAYQKTWGSGANKLTGLTTRNVGDNRVAVGFAFGATPQLLVVGKGGGGEVLKVATRAGSRFASPPKAAEGVRHLMRVTPASVEDKKAVAMIDLRDEYKDKRRVVACGKSDEAEPFVMFDGTSYLDLKDKPTGDERKKLFSSKIEGLEGYAELRDCRSSFSRKSKETWVMGSELVGVDKDDKVEWTAAFVLDQGAKEKERVIHKVKLKDDPPRSGFTFEVPAAMRVPDKGTVVTARFGGSLLVGVLDAKRKLQGEMKAYPGLPMLADLSHVGGQVIITTAIATGPGRFGLRALLFPLETMELPRGYTTVKVDDGAADNETDPELVVDKHGQRWVAYISGERDKGHLELVPVGADMKRVGRPYLVTEDKERASEARVVPLDDGDLLVVYIRDLEGKVELVSEELSCEVKH
jgi:hypothetical protein